jgi:hypothetical protein
MRRFALAPLLLLTLGSGCRREDPIERSAREYRLRHASRLATAKAETARTQALSDDQLVRLNPRNGLSLGLRLEKTEVRAGEPLKVRLVYENFVSDGPISATTCQGFSLGSEDEETLISTSVAVNFSCPEDVPNRDNNIALPAGALRTVNISTAGTKLVFDHPGQYIVVAGWQAFRPRDGMFLRTDEVAVVASNQVLVVVR